MNINYRVKNGADTLNIKTTPLTFWNMCSQSLETCGGKHSTRAITWHI